MKKKVNILEKIRCLLISMILFLTTSTHYLTNKNNKRIKGILYAHYGNTTVLKPIMNKLSGFELISPSIHKKKSFVRRTNIEYKINFNNIIIKPFLDFAQNEENLRKKFEKYMYKNYLEFLNKQKIEKIIMVDEFSIPHLALTKAAKKNNIETIALQHGVMYIDDKSYSGNVSYKKYKNINDCEKIVDKLIVYSEEEKKYLTKKSKCIKKKNVFAAGCPRYDSLIKNNKTKEQEEKIREYNIDKTKKIFLWTTQTHGLSEKENKINCEYLFSYFKNNKDKYEFLIKLHPNEKQTNTIYHKYNRKYSNIAKIIHGTEKTDVFLRFSDIILAKHSAVLFEAIILKKQIIFVDFFNSADISYFTNHGFNLILKKTGDIEKIFKKIETKSQKEKYEKSRKEFIKKHFNNLGKATEKTIEVIKK